MLISHALRSHDVDFELIYVTRGLALRFDRCVRITASTMRVRSGEVSRQRDSCDTATARSDRGDYAHGHALSDENLGS